jgi:AAHS family 4-hydroxybenzoate transporter-like MFS transporter
LGAIDSVLRVRTLYSKQRRRLPVEKPGMDGTTSGGFEAMSDATMRTIDLGQAIEAQTSSWYSRLILILCCVAMAIEGYDAQVIAYAAPAIIRDWHIDKAYFAPVFSAALFGYMIGATFLSGVSDKIGRQRTLVLGNLFFGLLTVASAFATTLPTLLALRFVAGLGLGCSIPSVMALGVEYAPERRRAFRVSVLFVGYTLGAALGGFVTAALMTQFGWQSAFYFGGFGSLAIGIVAYVFLPESARFLVVKGGEEQRIAAIMKRLRPDLGIEPTTRFTVAEDHVQPGLPVKYLFTDKRALMTSLLWLSFILSLTGHHFLTSWLPTVLDADGVPLAHAVVAGALIQFGGAAGSLIVGRLLDRIGIIAIALAFLFAIPFVILIGALGMPEYQLMAVVFMAGLFLLGGQVGLNALAGTIYPTFIRSTGAGWALGVGRIGSMLGPAIGGILIALKLSMPVLFLCAAIPAACCVVTVYLLRGVVLPGAPAGEPQRSSTPEAVTQVGALPLQSSRT